jgi:hypothetical protein
VKSRKYIIKYFVGYIVTVFIGILLLSACSPTDAYDYPIKPGTDEWKAFGSHDEMLQACQIPESILKDMSTAGLVETVLNYPLLLDYMAYDSRQYGLDMVVSHFNGLQELFNRKDAGTELLARYRTMDPAAIDNDWTDIEKGSYSFSFQDIEALLAQEPILTNLTEAQRQELLTEAIAKYQAKQQHAEVYGQYGQEGTVWLIGRALQQESYPPFEQKIQEDVTLQDFLSSGSFATDSVLNEILSQANQFLSGG